MTSPFQNFSHLPTTQCACVDFATQHNGGGSREKDLFWTREAEFLFMDRFQFFGQNHQRRFLFEIFISTKNQKISAKIKNLIILNDNSGKRHEMKERVVAL
jgi:hypothetical protein